ncbi:MAG: hypothetical protein MK116_13045 [Phycisphaerales bacterium]|nr:hypothetical protein [Phycisphaerales bacterium]
MRYLCPTIAILATIPGVTNAATITVPTDIPTIQAAIDIALDGDVILVEPGNYVAFDVSFQGKAITLRGSTDADGLPTSVLSSQGTGQVMYFVFTEGLDTVIENLVITQSGGNQAAVGVFGGSPTFNNITFRENTSALGGAVYNLNGAPHFTDCRFIDNSGDWGGAYACWETGQPEHPVFTRCLFEGNSADLGGAFANLRSQPMITECQFINNAATSNGGAFYNDGDSCCSQWEGNPILVDCIFDGNSAGDSGGAVYNSQFGLPTMERCTLQNNSAVVSGGGMASESTNVPTLVDCSICANTGTPSQVSGPWTDGGGNAIDNACPVECVGDLDDSGAVDVDDLLRLLSAFELNGDGDCDDDGDTDVNDLLVLIGRWGACP